ncbi:hypothetical protein EMIT0P294_10086 [Pseudomonas sp. IT-P294]
MKVSGAYVLPDETVELIAFCQRQIHTLQTQNLVNGKIVAQRGSLQGLLILGDSLFVDSLVNWCCKGNAARMLSVVLLNVCKALKVSDRR